MQLADPKVNQPAEYELTRGPFEYGGTWAPYGLRMNSFSAFGCDSELLSEWVHVQSEALKHSETFCVQKFLAVSLCSCVSR